MRLSFCLPLLIASAACSPSNRTRPPTDVDGGLIVDSGSIAADATLVDTRTTDGSFVIRMFDGGRPDACGFDCVPRCAFSNIVSLGAIAALETERGAFFWNGSAGGVLLDRSSRTDFVGIRADGTTLEPSQVVPGAILSGAIAASSASYGVAWVESSAVKFVRVGFDGRVIGAPVTVLAMSASQVAIASNGDEFAVLIATPTTVLFAHVSIEGAVVGTMQTVTTLWGAPLDYEIAWNGTAYSVLWGGTNGVGIHYALISARGFLTQDLRVTPNDPFDSPRMIITGDTVSFFWSTIKLPRGANFWHARLFVDGAPSGLPVQMVATSDEFDARYDFGVAAAPDGFLVAYNGGGTNKELRALKLNLYGAIVDGPVDVTNVAFPRGAAELGPRRPHVAATGAGYLVAYSEDGPGGRTWNGYARCLVP